MYIDRLFFNFTFIPENQETPSVKTEDVESGEIQQTWWHRKR